MAPVDNPPRRRVAAVVYNPIKVDLPELKKLVQDVASATGWDDTLWFSTTVEEAGQSVTREAIDAGASMVIAAGGDGTVRAVVEGLRDTGVPLGLLPSGTGNLLARNLDLTWTDLRMSIETAFAGVERRIDVGVAEITRESGESEEHAFLVMAGIGLDAKMMANTNSRLKKAVGWLAYVEGGARSLPGLKAVRLRYSLDDAPFKGMSAHTLIIGNCGYLPGGILLIPDARPDNGLLEVCALRPRGPFGWLKIWRIITWENGVLRRSAAGRRIIDLRHDVKSVTYFETKDMRVIVDGAQDFQIDGDPFGQVIAVRARVSPGSLGVMVPAAPGLTGSASMAALPAAG